MRDRLHPATAVAIQARESRGKEIRAESYIVVEQQHRVVRHDGPGPQPSISELQGAGPPQVSVATQNGERLLGHLRQDTIVLADKAYDADWLRRQIEAAGAAPNIPPMIHHRRKPCFSPVLYRARNRIERFFNRIKHFRRLATRYEKHASNFLAMLKLAAVHLWLRHNESVT